MEKQLLEPLDDAGLIYPFRFPHVEECENLIVVPIGSTLIWEMLMCARLMGYYDADLLSLPAFSARIIQGRRTAKEAVQTAFSLHKTKKMIIFQTSDYHHFRHGVVQQGRDDAHHKNILRVCAQELYEQRPDLERIDLVYLRVIDAHTVKVVQVDRETGVERPLMKLTCDCLTKSDGIIVTCIDFRFWREFMSFLWRHLHIRRPTIITLPGSTKRLIANESKMALEAIALAKNEYAAPNARVFCSNHWDCGAYGNELRGFNGDSLLIENYMAEESKKGAETLTSVSGIQASGIYARCDGKTIEHVLVTP